MPDSDVGEKEDDVGTHSAIKDTDIAGPSGANKASTPDRDVGEEDDDAGNHYA